jgi:ABC-2 type transport system permease protein
MWINYIRYPSWFVSMLIWPVLFPFGYVFTSKALAGPDGVALQAFSRLAGTADYTSFMAIGTTFWMWFNFMLWGLGGALRNEQVRGTLETNWLAPVPKIFLLIGAFVMEAMMGLIQLCVTGLLLYLIYGVQLSGSLWHVALIVMLSVPSVYGIGLMFASLVLVAKETSALIFFVRGLMTVFCGITYPIAVLPDWMKSVSNTLPLSHSIQAVRAVIAGNGLEMIRGQLFYLAASGVVLLMLGYATFVAIERRLTETGTIGQY